MLLSSSSLLELMGSGVITSALLSWILFPLSCPHFLSFFISGFLLIRHLFPFDRVARSLRHLTFCPRPRDWFNRFPFAFVSSVSSATCDFTVTTVSPSCWIFSSCSAFSLWCCSFSDRSRSENDLFSLSSASSLLASTSSASRLRP